MEKEQIKSLKDVKEELLTALKDAMMKYNEMTEFNGGYIQELEEAGLNISSDPDSKEEHLNCLNQLNSLHYVRN